MSRPLSAVFVMLADPARLAIVRRLAEGPAHVGALCAALDTIQESTSRHLGLLRLEGLVEVRREGRRRVYSLDRATLREAADLLAALAKEPAVAESA